MSESSSSAAVPLSARLARLFRRRLTWAALALAALLALAAGTALRRGDSAEYFTAKVSEGEIKDVVESTGTVSAVITVQVGSQVSGTISRLAADFNSRVRKGDVIAEIAPATPSIWWRRFQRTAVRVLTPAASAAFLVPCETMFLTKYSRPRGVNEAFLWLFI